MNELKVFSDDLIPVYVTDTGEQVVMGTELHERLEIATPYHKWFPRMTEYGFTEGTDFNPVKNVRVQKEGNREVKREVTDHVLSLDMAKHICMIQRTERGKRIRQKLIELEKKVSTPDSYMIEDPIERAKAWIRETPAGYVFLSVEESRRKPERYVIGHASEKRIWDPVYTGKYMTLEDAVEEFSRLTRI